MAPFRDPSGDDVVAFDDVPASDPIRPVIATILDVVPVSHWSFARFTGGGDRGQLLSEGGNGVEFEELRTQFIVERKRVGAGPSIAAMRPTAAYSSGLTLLFADSKAQFGILSLLRSASLGPFTSSEIRMLTFALDSASDHLSELRLTGAEAPLANPAGWETPSRALGDSDAAQYVLNRELEIVLAWTAQNERRVAVTPLKAQLEMRLPTVLEEAVRELTSAWTADATTQKSGAVVAAPFLVVRTRPMAGPAGLFIGVTIERPPATSPLTRAATDYGISPREVQVLALLLDGSQLSEIAQRLHLASSTVQDHIKNLLEKTGARNRSEMISKVFGWSGVRSASPPG